MFRIAKNLVKTFEQSVTDTIGAGDKLDSYFMSLPPNLLVPGNDSNSTLHGLRVIRCDETQLQVASFFDFIVGFNDMPMPLIQNQHGYLHPDFGSILRTINNSCGSSIKLNVWSGKGGFYRDEYVDVARKAEVEDVALDPATDQNHREFEPLGFSVQWAPLLAATYTYHVLEIHNPHGPASASGLVPQEDYIIGCQDGLLATGGETLLQEIVRSRANEELVLYVYNSGSDSVRPITTKIGGDGRLGCGVGYGYLHRIPDPQPADMPIFELPSSDAFVPAGQTAALPNTVATETKTTDNFIAPPPMHKRKTKPHSAATAASSMQDYFQEGKDQSPAASLKTPPPPPPAKNS
ncbi:LAMI_0F00980g1_1 [Lachancea mirantina]|uniref:LAMI_0F00980g1_1 n=1 Tax=Lachancea mirantina TaxID=1230905 RepID=A0A1G4JVM5_9SACH|nr:LAMI_0F00980g1_1 [Lachancea mirantina]